MSLWTPYGQHSALDLSKGAAVKVERRSPNFELISRPSASLEMREPRFPLLPTPLYVYPQATFEALQVPNMSPVRERVSPDSSMYLEVHSPPRELSPSQSPGSEAASLSPSGRAPVPPHARPFKAVTSALPSRIDLEECASSAAPDPDYAAYRASVLEAMIVKNGGSLCVSNPRMRRAVRRSSDSPDAEYLQRRARNNAAAKRSRDLRRMKEDELAIRATYLERVNQQLRAELEMTRRQLAQYQTATV